MKGIAFGTPHAVESHVSSRDEPTVLFCTGDDRQLDSFISAIQHEHPPGDWEVRVLRGERMVTWDGMLDEVSAALQFPFYFGRNAPALLDCLSDLAWMPSPCIVLVVTHVDEMLADAQGDAHDVLIINCLRAAARWREGIVWSGDETEYRAFHLILQTQEPVTVLDRVPALRDVQLGHFAL